MLYSDETIKNAAVRCPHPWDRFLVKRLLRSPTRFLADPYWAVWFEQRGGIAGIYDYLRSLPLSKAEHELLNLLLEQSRDTAQVHIQKLHISRATYFTHRERLLEVLVVHLNAWDLEQSRLSAVQRTYAGSPAHSGQLDRRLLARSDDTTPLLPSLMTSLIGRDEDIRAVLQLIQRQSLRLVTLTGPGGIGKTRLALQVAHLLLPIFTQGAIFVPLGPVNDPDLVVSAIAHACGVKDRSKAQLFERLKTFLQHRKMLLVLDNFEQVVAAGGCVMDLLAAAPLLTIIVTSRTLLHIPGEHEYFVQPLQLPDPETCCTDVLATAPAVALFCDRALAADWQFVLNDENARMVVEICYRLDGLPLAIELAASQLKWYSLQTICEGLHNRMELLVGELQHCAAHQQSLRSTIEWSYRLLQPFEQRLFARLGVFVGAFTLEAVRSVCLLGDESPISLEYVVLCLLNKSMIQRQVGPEPFPTAGEPPLLIETQYLRVLETLREYAFERLSNQDIELFLARHAAYYLDLAEAAEPELGGAEVMLWQAHLVYQVDNIRAALRWMLSKGMATEVLRLSSALMRFWEGQGLLSEGRYWLESGIQRIADVPEAIAAKAYRVVGLLSWLQGDNEQARQYYEAGLVLSHRVGDMRGVARTLNNCAIVELQQGNFERARELLTEGLSAARSGNTVFPLPFLLYNLGRLAFYQSDYQQADALLGQSLCVAWEQQNIFHVAEIMITLGYVRFGQGDEAQAAALFEAGLCLRHALPDKEGTPACLEAIAVLMEARGFYKRAVRLFGAAKQLRQRLGNPLTIEQEARIQRMRCGRQNRLPRAVWAAVSAEGYAMTLEQAVAYALQSLRLRARNRPEQLACATGDGFDVGQRSEQAHVEVEIVRLVLQKFAHRKEEVHKTAA